MLCIHALFFITSLRGSAAEIDQYVHEYYSVDKFKATYAENVPSIEAKHQWDIVDPGFVMHAPIQGRAPGRPKKKLESDQVLRELDLGLESENARDVADLDILQEIVKMQLIHLLEKMSMGMRKMH